MWCIGGVKMSCHKLLFVACVGAVFGLNLFQGVNGSWMRKNVENELGGEQTVTVRPEIFEDMESSEELHPDRGSGDEPLSEWTSPPRSRLPPRTTSRPTTTPPRTTTPRTSPTSGAGNGVVLGCYRDSENRALNGRYYFDYRSMTHGSCVNFCFNNNYRYAGIENAGECFCGNTLNQEVAHNCHRQCPGDSSTLCGGDWALTVLNTGYDGPEPDDRPVHPCGSSRPAIVNASHGWISSPNYPNQYGNSENCAWLISSPSPNEIVSISFPTVSMESCCDYVRIYDGRNNNAPLLGEFNGQKNDLTYTTTQQYMFVSFTTDGSVTYNGFNATFSVPVDTTGSIVTYTINIEGQSVQNDTDLVASIILYGARGATQEFVLDNVGEGYSPSRQYVFPGVESVGVVKCVDFKLSSSQSDSRLYIESVRVNDGVGPGSSHSLQRYYTTDSTTWHPTHGCGIQYRVGLSGSYRSYGRSYGSISVILIGDEGNSAELILGSRFGESLGPGDSTSGVFSLPRLGNISCINIRRNLHPGSSSDSQWHAATAAITSSSGESTTFIEVDQPIPLKSNIPGGIVSCVEGSALCMDNFEETCPSPSLLKQLKSSSELELIQALINADLFDICPQIEDYTSCARSFVKINEQCPHEQQLDQNSRRILTILSLVAEQLCGRYIAEFSCQKECLLQTNEDGQLILPQSIMKQCAQYIAEPAQLQQPPLCQSHEFVNCIKNTITAQCNREIADVIANVYGEVSDKLCDPSTKPACPYNFELSETGCHKLVTDRRSWGLASSICSQVGPAGGHLVFIDNDAEERAVNGLIRRDGGLDCIQSGSGLRAVWTGGRRRPWPPAYRWYYNETAPAKSLCHPGLRAGSWGGSEDACLTIQADNSTNTQWQGTGCYSDYCYICEIDL